MAIRTTCPNCKNEFSAQETYLGKKVKCPRCSARVAVLEPAVRREQDVWQREQQQRLELFEELEKKSRETPSYATEYGTGIDPVRNFNPGAMSRFRKLRALSRFMILSAYLLLALVIAAAGVTVWLYNVGVIESVGVLVLIFLGEVLALLFFFCTFKFLGELSWLLADVGDHQLDVRNLLLDVREDLDRVTAANVKDETPV